MCIKLVLNARVVGTAEDGVVDLTRSFQA